MKDGSQAYGAWVSEKWPEGGVFPWACAGEVDRFLKNIDTNVTGHSGLRVLQPRGLKQMIIIQFRKMQWLTKLFSKVQPRPVPLGRWRLTKSMRKVDFANSDHSLCLRKIGYLKYKIDELSNSRPRRT